MRHMLIHTGEKPFPCDSCELAFNQNAILKVHKLIHSGEKPHKCQICDKAFNQGSNLKRHLKVHENDDQNNKSVVWDWFEHNMDKLTAHCTKCAENEVMSNIKICNGKPMFSLKMHMWKRHRELFHKIQDEDVMRKVILNKWFPSNGNQRKLHACNVCGKQVTSSMSLRHHKRIHSNERPYCCDNCDKSFRVPQELKRHNMTHTDYPVSFSTIINCIKKVDKPSKTHSNPLNCSHCEKLFKSEAGLKKHNFSGCSSRVGRQVRPCNVCGRKFSTKKVLARHENFCSQQKKSGSNEQDRSCCVCGRKFSNNKHLSRHESYCAKQHDSVVI